MATKSLKSLKLKRKCRSEMEENLIHDDNMNAAKAIANGLRDMRSKYQCNSTSHHCLGKCSYFLTSQSIVFLDQEEVSIFSNGNPLDVLVRILFAESQHNVRKELRKAMKCLQLPKHASNSHLCWLNDEVVAQSYGQHLATYITLTLPQVVNAYCTLVARSRNLEKIITGYSLC